MAHLGHDESDLDVPLPKGTEDEEYLATVFHHLKGVLDDFKPDLVLYDAGVAPRFEAFRCVFQSGCALRGRFGPLLHFLGGLAEEGGAGARDLGLRC